MTALSDNDRIRLASQHVVDFLRMKAGDHLVPTDADVRMGEEACRLGFATQRYRSTVPHGAPKRASIYFETTPLGRLLLLKR